MKNNLIASLFLIVSCYMFWYCIFGGHWLLTGIFGSSTLIIFVLLLLVEQIFMKGGNK